MLATSLTIGIGGSGGIFAPSLFLGAMLGSAYGQALQPPVPAPDGARRAHTRSSAWPRCSRRGARADHGGPDRVRADRRLPHHPPADVRDRRGNHAPSILSRDTIYSLKLTRRGIDILQRKQPTLLQSLTVADAARPMPQGLPGDLPLDLVADRFAEPARSRSRSSTTRGRLQGVVRLGDVTDALASAMPDTTASDLVTQHETLRGDVSLEDALERLAAFRRAPARRGRRAWRRYRAGSASATRSTPTRRRRARSSAASTPTADCRTRSAAPK